jgi:hypothetical protein
LVVIDQLEELFTLASASERDAFLAALRALRAERRCVVIVTLRADFFGALMESPLWPERGRDKLSCRGPRLMSSVCSRSMSLGIPE